MDEGSGKALNKLDRDALLVLAAIQSRAKDYGVSFAIEDEAISGIIDELGLHNLSDDQLRARITDWYKEADKRSVT